MSDTTWQQIHDDRLRDRYASMDAPEPTPSTPAVEPGQSLVEELRALSIEYCGYDRYSLDATIAIKVAARREAEWQAERTRLNEQWQHSDATLDHVTEERDRLLAERERLLADARGYELHVEVYKHIAGKAEADLAWERRAIGNLLAVIFRDGGQRQAEINNLAEACVEAEMAVLADRQPRVELDGERDRAAGEVGA